MAKEQSHVEPDLIEVKFQRGFRPSVEAFLKRGEWTRLFSLPEQEIDAMTAQARRAAGKDVPDLNSYFRLRVPATVDVDATVRELNALPEVETAYRVSAPVPPPVAPDFSTPAAPGEARAYQGYLDKSPAGVDARYAWALGFDGTGITIVDVEFNWDRNHGDLKPLTVIGGEPDPPAGRAFGPFHGTATLGVFGGRANGSGVRGIASGATHAIAASRTAGDFSVADAIGRAVAAVHATSGAVVLLEQQASGPGERFVPAEFVESTYDATVLGVALGVTIVAAAGNGGLNLADPSLDINHRPFAPGNESGAIIVSASQGGPDNRQPQGDQNGNGCFGPRVDVHAWGMGVVTTIGAERPHEIDDANEIAYDGGATSFWQNYSGTSAASAIVAGAAAVYQHFFIATNGRPARPDEVRAIFRETGTPQGGDAVGRRIGPMPDLKAAIERTLSREAVDAPVLDPAYGFAIRWPAFFGSAGSGWPEFQVRIDYTPGADQGSSELRYEHGAIPSRLSSQIAPGTEITFTGPAALTARVFKRSPATGLFSASPITTGQYIVWDFSRVPGCTTVLAFLVVVAVVLWRWMG